MGNPQVLATRWQTARRQISCPLSGTLSFVRSQQIAKGWATNREIVRYYLSWKLVCGRIRYNGRMFERPRVVIVTGSGDRAAAVPLPLGSRPRAPQSSSRILTKSAVTRPSALLNQRGGRATFCPADVADELQVQQLIKFTESKFGAPSVLVNNASSPHPAGEGMAGGPTRSGWISSGRFMPHDGPSKQCVSPVEVRS